MKKVDCQSQSKAQSLNETQEMVFDISIILIQINHSYISIISRSTSVHLKHFNRYTKYPVYALICNLYRLILCTKHEDYAHNPDSVIFNNHLMNVPSCCPEFFILTCLKHNGLSPIAIAALPDVPSSPVSPIQYKA